LFEANGEWIIEVFEQTLVLIKDAFQVPKIFVVRGAVVDGGPTTTCEPEAAKLFIRLASSRR